ncbi:hypothetical protein [Nocardia anaemiae]|uniref:hypothetical protein n=1 Tax=Nocardia anaemiae TaxID=263910 RepID=UPI0007A54531|nr:hypothetical protein [Nocardia anaemiae]
MSMINTEDRDFMRGLKEALSEDIAKYNADPRYSPDGRRKLIAQTYLAARKLSEQTYEKFAEASRVKHREIERKLFGPGSKDHAAIMSWRDALDRVDQIDGKAQALRKFERACISGDDLLAKAILQQAVRVGWTDVLDSAGKHMPQQADLIDEWLSTPSDSALNTLKLGYQIRRPSELKDATEEELRQWAGEAPAELPEQTYQPGPNGGVAVFSLSGPETNGPDHAANARKADTAKAQAANDAFIAAANSSLGTVA